MTDSPRILVARFLRANNYDETLEAFLHEADLPSDAGELSTGALTIEKILDEKRLFDVSLNFEKLAVDDAPAAWSLPAPVLPTVIADGVDDANILHVSFEKLAGSRNDPITESSIDVILATTASRKLHLLQAGEPHASVAHHSIAHDSPILSCLVLDERYLLTAHMSGKVMIQDYLSGVIISERHDHRKYVVKAAVLPLEEGQYLVATAGWDARVFVYLVRSGQATVSSGIAQPALLLGDPLATLDLTTNPEALAFIKHPETQSPILILSRRDSTFLYYYVVSTATSSVQPPRLLGRQNLAPHSAGWIAFSPCDIAISPVDPSVAAIATSSMPHMKLLIVRMLIPPVTADTATSSTTNIDLSVSTATPAAQARAEIALQDREEAAIMVHCNTLAPQTEYSTPALVWRPDGSGIWVNGDDGQIRGVETTSGKVVSTLRGGHEPGAKIRCLGSGTADGREVLVSGGFDRRLVVWDIDQSSSSTTN